MSLAAGTRLGPYEVLGLIGAGGMGEVYKARDTRLDRTVAIKILPAELSSDPVRRARFEREAKTIAGLTHPHICTLHDVGTHAGTMYLVMEHFGGESLAERLRRGPLPIGQALDIAGQIADALDAAHTHGIVHRDLKPGNVMLTAGVAGRSGVTTAKLLDFGLAKLAARGEQPALVVDAKAPTMTAPVTARGTILGTLQYMAPEQLEGRDSDARSDVWALGVVLFEMLTGQLPFRATSDLSLAAAILHERPHPISRYCPDLPQPLNRVLNRALEKDPARRYQRVADLGRELSLVTQEVLRMATQSPSIVVLPFQNMSPDPDQEYFCDGMTEEIISSLSQVRALRVISRSSAMTFKGGHRRIRDIADELNVRYVLEGSVRKAQNALRITAQLIDATTDSHVWAQKYAGTLDDVFVIQENVARLIVEALELEISPQEERKLAERRIEDIQAYECCLRAREEVYRFTEESFERALRILRYGLDSAGESVLIHALMGNIYIQYVNSLIRPNAEYLQQAEECATRILAIDPSSSQGHWLRGALCHKRGNIQEGVRHLKKALEADPGNPDTLYWLSYAYRVSGQGTAARPLILKLVSIDPLTPYSHWAAGWIDFFDGRTEEALRTFQKMCELDPDNPLSRWGYAFGLAADGRYDTALPIFDRLVAEAPRSFHGQHGLFLMRAFQGDRPAALSAMTEELAGTIQWDEHVSWMTAVAYAVLGERTAALEWLETAVRMGFINYPYLAEHDRILRELGGEDRYHQLMELVKRRWEQFDV